MTEERYHRKTLDIFISLSLAYATDASMSVISMLSMNKQVFLLGWQTSFSMTRFWPFYNHKQIAQWGWQISGPFRRTHKYPWMRTHKYPWIRTHKYPFRMTVDLFMLTNRYNHVRMRMTNIYNHLRMRMRMTNRNCNFRMSNNWTPQDGKQISLLRSQRISSLRMSNN